jgi:hypothetical protein
MIEITDNTGTWIRVETIPGYMLDEPKLVSILAAEGEWGDKVEVWLNLEQALALRDALTDEVG